VLRARFPRSPWTQDDDSLEFDEQSDAGVWTTHAATESSPKCVQSGDSDDSDDPYPGIEEYRLNFLKAIDVCKEELNAQQTSDPGETGLKSYNLGRAFAGMGDFDSAKKFFRAAIALGHRMAKVALAQLELRDFDSEIRSEAIRYLKDADASGLAIASWRLGELYWRGLGVEENPDLVLELILRGAEGGFPRLMFGLDMSLKN
jgi:tetratricopeptide (TPR) repeat protein